MKQIVINQALFKTLSVMYVEDELEYHQTLISTLKKLFHDVHAFSNGQDAIDFFKANQDKVDLVLSDHNMPIKNGMELLEDIRAIDSDVPFIFLSANFEYKILLRSIELDVSHFAPKPVDIRNLLIHVMQAMESGYNKKQLIKKQLEINEYVNIIDQIAIISKTDLKGNITFVNDVFCEVSGYSKEELIGKPHNIVRHAEVPKEIYKEMWATIRNKEIFKGVIKNKAKDGSEYVVNATILPIMNDETETLSGYMAIRFLVTDEENKKREFRTQVRNLMTKNNEEKASLLNTIEELNAQIFKLENSDYIEQRLAEEKQKIALLNNQINHYEKDIAKLKEINEHKLKKLQDKLLEASKTVSKYQKEVREASHEATEHRLAFNEKDKRIKELEASLKKANLTIDDYYSELVDLRRESRKSS